MIRRLQYEHQHDHCHLFLIWWVTLFAVLPWGVRNQEESGDVVPGTDPGTPAIHRVWAKLGWTTVIATVNFGILYVLYLAILFRTTC